MTQFKRVSKILIILQLTLSLLFQVSSKSHTESLTKKLKLQSCSYLTKLRVSKDMDYINTVSSFVNPDANPEENFNQLMSLAILSCFKNLSDEKVMEVGNIADESEKGNKQPALDIMSNEYKDILGIERWEEVYRANDEKAISEEIQKHGQALNELRRLKESYNEDIQSTGNEREEEESTAGEGYYDRRNVQQDLSLFGYRIDQLSFSTKAIFGLSFIVLITVGIILGLRKATEGSVKKKKNKKKKGE